MKALIIRTAHQLKVAAEEHIRKYPALSKAGIEVNLDLDVMRETGGPTWTTIASLLKSADEYAQTLPLAEAIARLEDAERCSVETRQS